MMFQYLKVFVNKFQVVAYVDHTKTITCEVTLGRMLS